MRITSVKNPHIKELVKLRKSTVRKKTGLTIVDGIREVMCAVKAGCPVKEFYTCPEQYDAQRMKRRDKNFLEAMFREDIPVHETAENVFQKIAFGDRSEGILAVCQPDSKKLRDIKNHQKAFYIIVDKVEKPGNLGAILRTCDGVGVDALIVCDPATDIYNPNCIRASLGTVFSVPVVPCSPPEALTFLKQNDVKLIAAVPDAQEVYTGIDFRDSVAVLVGSEHAGLNPFWKDNADVKVKIPMSGISDSLNVSASTAIIAYEAVRQRQNK